MAEIKKIIVAPLNWGLGHATRCIPIISSLLDNEFTPVIAGDGEALQLLQKEFPNLAVITLPSYNIKYKKNLKLGLFFQIPRLRKVVLKETQVIDNYINKNNVYGIISDNRFGVRSEKVPSVYITHQLKVLSGITTFFTTQIHQSIIRKYDECWIPDVEGASSLSGKLSTVKNMKIKYLGILSRLEREKQSIKNDVLILLSGPEPQRGILEKLLLTKFEKYHGRVVLVRGKVEKAQTESRKNNILVFNYVLREQLQELINASALIICRSGYSSILDAAKLQKKVFFIPTPHQSEQEYLATYLEKQKIAPFAKQHNFKLEMLKNINGYSGFQNTLNSKIESNLFDLFQRKGKS